MQTKTTKNILKSVPHVIPYQGSKRKLAARICHFFPQKANVLYEPFAGSAALSIYAATHGLAKRFLIGDILEPLVQLHKMIVEHPEKTAKEYETIWKGQGDTWQKRYDYFFSIRTRYNNERDPVLLLFLIARCVANAIRFSNSGNFTQSPDKRRMGTRPEKMRKSIFSVSALLKGKAEFVVGDFADCVSTANAKDIVYLDPPYRGTTEGNDKRYFKQLETERLIKSLETLQAKNVRFILSYDGSHGEKRYGEDLPPHLRCKKFSLQAGRSTQGTLNGREIHTTESLYVSEELLEKSYQEAALLAV